MADYIGRTVAVGIAKEAVRGTAVAPAFWVRHLSLDFKKRGEAVQNESALGRREKFSDSEIVREFAEGNLEGKVNSKSIGLILLAAFGDVNSVANGAGYDHTFTVDQSNTPQSLTVTKVDGVNSRRHALAMIRSLEINIEAGEYIKFTADLVARKGTDSPGPETIAYVEEYEFTSKDAFVRFADTVATVGAASNSAIKSGRITLDLGVEPYYEVGSTDPAEIHAGAIEVTGEIVARHSDDSYEDMYYTNTKKAMQFGFENTAIDLGGGLNPALVFTLPQVSVTDFDTSNDLDAIVEQTLGLTGQINLDEGYAVEAVLTNDQATY